MPPDKEGGFRWPPECTVADWAARAYADLRGVAAIMVGLGSLRPSESIGRVFLA